MTATKRTKKTYAQGFQDGRTDLIAQRKYHGWTNYETWNVKLWIDNEQSTQEYWLDRASKFYALAKPEKYLTKEEVAIRELSESLKESIEADIPEIGNSLYSDILTAAISDVNWYELAESFIADVKERTQND